jgi:hypothetical protein
LQRDGTLDIMGIRTLLVLVAGGVAAFATGAACSAGYETAASPDGGASEGGGSVDGSTSDGSSASDAGSAADSTTSDSSDIDGSTSTDFCSDASFICDDFDNPPATWPSPPWGAETLSGGGALAFTNTSVVSPPNALSMTLPARDGGASAVLEAEYVGGAHGMNCQAKVKVVSRGTQTLNFVDLQVMSGAALYYRMVLQLQSGATNFAVNTNAVAAAALPLGVFTNVSWNAVFDGTTTLTIGTTSNALSTVPAGGSPMGGSLKLSVSEAVGDSNAWQVIVDDVRCDLVQ